MYLVYGTIAATCTLTELTALLSKHGLQFALRESSHYPSGRYLRLLASAVHLTIERIAENECLLRADAESLDEIAAILKELSVAFAALRIPHRLELYGDDDELVESFSCENSPSGWK